MYADQLEAQSKRSVKERLNGNFAAGGGGRRIITGKRQREDDGKWEHDLFLDDIASGSSDRKKIGSKDLRFKLQRKSTVEKANQNVRESIFGASRDLREKLSGPSYSLPSETKTLPVRPNPALVANKPTRKSVIAQTPNIRTNASNSTTTKKADSVESFLQSLGLEKYSITFQAEEVDMTALLHMRDEDLKAIGIPM
ncbi:hypothetical protein M569_07691, partial [Genlisea aurea]